MKGYPRARAHARVLVALPLAALCLLAASGCQMQLIGAPKLSARAGTPVTDRVPGGAPGASSADGASASGGSASGGSADGGDPALNGNAPRPSSSPLALVYAGPGVLYGPYDTLARAEQVAEQAGFEVIEVTGLLDTQTLARASLWVQPGGPNLAADEFMNATGLSDQVRAFVRRGGGYVGFCGGAYSAVNNLGLIAGQAYGWGHETAKVPVTWRGHVRYLHYEHGPYLVLTDKSAEVVGTYEDGKIAAARGRYGKGWVFISGVHPEAGDGWPPTYDPDGSDTALAVGMMRESAQWVGVGWVF